MHTHIHVHTYRYTYVRMYVHTTRTHQHLHTTHTQTFTHNVHTHTHTIPHITYLTCFASCDDVMESRSNSLPSGTSTYGSSTQSIFKLFFNYTKMISLATTNHLANYIATITQLTHINHQTSSYHWLQLLYPIHSHFHWLCPLDSLQLT